MTGIDPVDFAGVQQKWKQLIPAGWRCMLLWYCCCCTFSVINNLSATLLNSLP